MVIKANAVKDAKYLGRQKFAYYTDIAVNGLDLQVIDLSKKMYIARFHYTWKRRCRTFATADKVSIIVARPWRNILWPGSTRRRSSTY